MRYKKLKAGEWVQPRMKDYRMACCDCGLVHRLVFKIVTVGKKAVIRFKAYRHVRDTKLLRKKDGITIKREL